MVVNGGGGHGNNNEVVAANDPERGKGEERHLRHGEGDEDRNGMKRLGKSLIAEKEN